ncbi:MlaD family protein [soil metagenome]
MDPRVNFTLVGLFVVVFGAALIWTVVWLSAQEDHKTYETYVAYVYESVAGLSPRAAVKYRGVDVGFVRKIGLDKGNPERVRLLLDIEAGTPVKADTVALLSVYGITGLAFVDLTGGNRQSAPLAARPGERYPEIHTGPSLLASASSGLMQATQLAQEFKKIAEQILKLLNQENQDALSNTLRSIERITTALATRDQEIGTTLVRVSAILDNAARTAQELPALLSALRKGAEGIHSVLGTVDRTATNFDQMIVDTRADLGRFSRGAVAQAIPIMTDLRQLVDNLQRLTEAIERDPNALLFGRRVRRGPGE